MEFIGGIYFRMKKPSPGGGAPRSESKFTMIASGNHTIIYDGGAALAVTDEGWRHLMYGVQFRKT